MKGISVYTIRIRGLCDRCLISNICSKACKEYDKRITWILEQVIKNGDLECYYCNGPLIVTDLDNTMHSLYLKCSKCEAIGFGISYAEDGFLYRDKVHSTYGNDFIELIHGTGFEDLLY